MPREAKPRNHRKAPKRHTYRLPANGPFTLTRHAPDGKITDCWGPFLAKTGGEHVYFTKMQNLGGEAQTFVVLRDAQLQPLMYSVRISNPYPSWRREGDGFSSRATWWRNTDPGKFACSLPYPPAPALPVP